MPIYEKFKNALLSCCAAGMKLISLHQEFLFDSLSKALKGFVLQLKFRSIILSAYAVRNAGGGKFWSSATDLGCNDHYAYCTTNRLLREEARWEQWTFSIPFLRLFDLKMGIRPTKQSALRFSQCEWNASIPASWKLRHEVPICLWGESNKDEQREFFLPCDDFKRILCVSLLNCISFATKCTILALEFECKGVQHVNTLGQKWETNKLKTFAHLYITTWR